MSERDRLLRLIQQLYLAPGSADGWRPFLSALTTDQQATGAAFVSQHYSSERAAVADMAGFDPEAIREYERYWFTRDPWAHNPVVLTVRSGTVVTGEQLNPQDAVARGDYYNEFGTRFGIQRAMIAMIEVEPRAVSALTINATEWHGRFTRRDVRFFNALMPHLQRALQIHRRLASAEGFSNNLASALEHLAHGVCW